MKTNPVEFLTMAVIILFLIFYLSILVKYGNTPMNECPVWVWWLLRGN